MGDWTRPLTEAETAQIGHARDTAWILYDGVQVPHRSCGIAMAETFERPTASYRTLRRGGLTGLGPCGVAQAGRMILGELFGDPDPAGPVTDELRTAMQEYEARLPVGQATCQALVGHFEPFKGPERHRYCTTLAADVAALLAEVVLRNGGTLPQRPSE